MKFGHPSDREIRPILLSDAIAEIHTRSRGTYEMLRIRATLEIERVSSSTRRLVWKIMRQLGLQGLPGPKKGVRTSSVATSRTSSSDRLWRVSQPAVVDRHHRAPDRRRKDLLLCGARPLQPQGGRLGHRPTLRVSPRHRRRQQGQGQPFQRSSTVIHFDRDPITSWAFTENVRRLGPHQLHGRCSVTASTTPRWSRSELHPKLRLSIDKDGAQTSD